MIGRAAGAQWCAEVLEALLLYGDLCADLRARTVCTPHRAANDSCTLGYTSWLIPTRSQGWLFFSSVPKTRPRGAEHICLVPLLQKPCRVSLAAMFDSAALVDAQLRSRTATHHRASSRLCLLSGCQPRFTTRRVGLITSFYA